MSRELIEKFSKRTRLIEQLAREKYTIIEAEARQLVKKTGMDFADAFAQVKSKLGAESREAKSSRHPWTRRAVSKLAGSDDAGGTRFAEDRERERTASQNLLESETAKNLAIQHLFERASVARELHAAGMLLRRGIGRVSVEEARGFARADDRFVRRRGSSSRHAKCWRKRRRYWKP